MDTFLGSRGRGRRARGRSRSAGGEGPEEAEDGLDEESADDPDAGEAHEAVEVAGVDLDLAEVHAAAGEEAKIAGAGDEDSSDSDEDDLDEKEAVIDESWTELPTAELTAENVGDAMAAADDGAVPAHVKEEVQSDDDGDGLLFELELAHEHILEDKRESEAAAAPPRSAASESDHDCLIRRGCILWEEVAADALSLLDRIRTHNNSKPEPEVGHLALCLRRYDPADEDDRKLGTIESTEAICWLHIDATGAGSWRGRITKVCPSSGRIEFVIMGPQRINSKPYSKHLEDGRLKFLVGNCGVGMFRGGSDIRNHVESDLLKFSNMYKRMLVCATASASVDLACELCRKPLAYACALCGLNWHSSCVSGIAASACFRQTLRGLSRSADADAFCHGANSIDYPPGSCCSLCERLMEAVS